jgi:hypothetical protein
MGRLIMCSLFMLCFGRGQQLREFYCTASFGEILLIRGRLMNVLSTTQDFVHYFSICRPKFVFVDASLWDVANAALYEIHGLEATQVTVLGDGGSDEIVHVRIFHILVLNL